MHASPVSATVSTPASGFWAAAGAYAYASLLAAGPLAFTVEAGVWVPVSSPRFELTGVGGTATTTGFQPSQVEGRTAFFGEVRF